MEISGTVHNGVVVLDQRDALPEGARVAVVLQELTKDKSHSLRHSQQVEPPLPSEPFLTEEITAPFSLPRPEGTPTRAVRVPQPLPTAHDLPDEE